MSIATIGITTSTADRRRRAGQRLMIGLSGPSITADERALIRELQPAGFILFARNVEEPAQVRELNRELKSLLDPAFPALCAVDQEGGRVLRIKSTSWPPMAWLGNADHPALTASVARAMAQELRAMAFDVDFAPVADVHSNPKNPVIGDRSFGSTPEKVARHLAAFIPALQEEGIIGCAKHFPGHGDTQLDSHEALPTVEEDPDRLLSREVAPFRAALSANVGMVMTAHVVYPAWDEQNPATMSSKIQRGILREKLGFGGVLVSDDLEMKAVRGRFPLDLQLERASSATVDLFLACKTPELQFEAWETLIRLQEEDKRQEDAATDSVRRIHALRERFLKNQSPMPDISVVGCAAFQAIALRVRVEGGG